MEKLSFNNVSEKRLLVRCVLRQILVNNAAIDNLELDLGDFPDSEKILENAKRFLKAKQDDPAIEVTSDVLSDDELSTFKWVPYEDDMPDWDEYHRRGVARGLRAEDTPHETWDPSTDFKTMRRKM